MHIKERGRRGRGGEFSFQIQQDLNNNENS